MVPCECLEFVGLDLLDNGMLRRYIPQFTSHLASLGLEFSVKLIDASGDHPKRRRDLIYETMEAFGAKDLDFLPEALSHSPWIERRFNHNAGGNFHAFFTADIRAQYGPGGASTNSGGWEEDEDEEAGGDDNEEEDPTRPNSWYRGLNQNQRRSFEDSRTPVYRRINMLWYDSLREMGYVFWDKSRLVGTRYAQYLHNPRREGAGLVFVVEGDREREKKERSCWGYRETVEERLKGVKIPASQWRRLVEEFTTEPDDDYSYLERRAFWEVDTSSGSSDSDDSILEDSE